MNSYEKSLSTIVIESSKDYVILKDSIFHKEGGGQPMDKGWIDGQEILGYDGEKFALKNNAFKKGQKVLLSIDWDYRYSLMKAHTAEHLLFGSLKNINPSLEVEKIQLSENESKIFIRGNVQYSDLVSAQILANEKIKEDLKIAEKMVKKEDAKDARIKIGRIKESSARIISIGDFDMAACIGTHLASTKEIGMLIVSGLKKESSNISQLSFLVGSKAIEHSIKSSALIAELSNGFNETFGKLKQRIMALLDENEGLKSDLRKLCGEFLDSVKLEAFNGIIFHEFRMADTGRLIKKASDESTKSDVVFLKGDTIIVAGKNSQDIFLKLKEKFGIIGGGREVKTGKIQKPDAEGIKKILFELKY
jgi:alanyl-tRNA synthetase